MQRHPCEIIIFLLPLSPPPKNDVKNRTATCHLHVFGLSASSAVVSVVLPSTLPGTAICAVSTTTLFGLYFNNYKGCDPNFDLLFIEHIGQSAILNILFSKVKN